MHLKITPHKRVIAPFPKYGFRDFWRDYDNLNVAIDPDVS